MPRYGFHKYLVYSVKTTYDYYCVRRWSLEDADADGYVAAVLHVSYEPLPEYVTSPDPEISYKRTKWPRKDQDQDKL